MMRHPDGMKRSAAVAHRIFERRVMDATCRQIEDVSISARAVELEARLALCGHDPDHIGDTMAALCRGFLRPRRRILPRARKALSSESFAVFEKCLVASDAAPDRREAGRHAFSALRVFKESGALLKSLHL